NQFHDIIPGSSIKEVYDDCREEYAEAERVASEAWEAAATALTAGGAATAMTTTAVGTALTGGAEGMPLTAGASADAVERQAYTVWNSAGWSRTEQVVLSGVEASAGVWEDSEGTALAAQHNSDSGDWHVLVPEVPGLGQRTIYFRPGEEAASSVAADIASTATDETVSRVMDESALPTSELTSATASGDPFRIGERELESPYYIVAWDAQGRLIRIYDKTAQREVLAPGEQGNVLQVFEDKPKSRHEAWDIDLFYQEKQRTVDELLEARVVACGPLYVAVSFVWTYMDSRIEQQMRLYADDRRIDFVTRADWQEKRQLLKVAFPVDIRATEATYDIQFGNVRRPTHWNTSWDYARFESVGHQWADLSERGYGVSLLNDCKYGYDIKDHTMRLTLIKSAIVPDPTADLGEHVFTYALLPHRGDWLEGGAVPSAFALNQSLSVSRGDASELPEALFTVTGDAHVMIDAIKKSEDGTAVVLRLHEYGGSRGEVRIVSDYGIRAWQACDLLERPEGERRAEAELRTPVKPYELLTFLIELA
ncbi:alpha-mannosidase, partial [Paenibacillus sp. 598K]|uniref:alpha-mannosidase n=1 Tax=Paenibacillus sp. 598K TaxID=1117987 RepID=UPI0021AAA79D